jgi:threonine synthase
MGIVNGTTNYILDRMDREGSEFADVLADAQRLGYAEADPTADVEGYDAAQKAAILASLAFHTAVPSTRCTARASPRSTADDGCGAPRRLRHQAAPRRVRAAHGCRGELAHRRGHLGAGVPRAVPREHPLASVHGANNAVFVQAEAAGNLMFYGAGRAACRPRRPCSATSSRPPPPHRRRRRASASPRARTCRSLPIGRITTRYQITLEVRRAGRARHRRRHPQRGRVSIAIEQTIEPAARAAPHGVAGIAPRHRHRRASRISATPSTASPPAAWSTGRVGPARRNAELAVAAPKKEMEMAHVWQGVLREYADRLGVTDASTVVTLGEGGTPLIPAAALSQMTGANVYVKFEGMNPTGSFKDRGMTVALSRAVEHGAKAVICASTGNTSASAAAYAAHAGITAAVLVPEGKIAMGKLSQAVIHGGGSSRCAATSTTASRSLASSPTTTPCTSSTRSTPTASRAEDGRVRGRLAARRCPDFHFIPVGNAGNYTAYTRGYREEAERGVATKVPRMFGFQAEGSAPLVRGEVVKNPRRSPRRSASATPRRGSSPSRRATRRRLVRRDQRRQDPRGAEAPGIHRRRLRRAGSAISVAGLLDRAEAGIVPPVPRSSHGDRPRPEGPAVGPAQRRRQRGRAHRRRRDDERGRAVLDLA